MFMSFFLLSIVNKPHISTCFGICKVISKQPFLLSLSPRKANLECHSNGMRSEAQNLHMLPIIYLCGRKMAELNSIETTVWST